MTTDVKGFPGAAEAVRGMRPTTGASAPVVTIPNIARSHALRVRAAYAIAQDASAYLGHDHDGASGHRLLIRATAITMPTSRKDVVAYLRRLADELDLTSTTPPEAA